ncbi:MAG: pyruvate kinase, partial [Desulfobacterales bacterium]
RMINAGMNIARINFSHGTRENHKHTFKRLRHASQKAKQEIAILQDLQGHKVRVGRLKKGDELRLATGGIVRIGFGEWVTAERIGIDYPKIADFVETGHRIFLDDGMINLNVLTKGGEDLICEVIIGGMLKSRKGIIFPDSNLEFPLLNKKDMDDAQFGAHLDVDMIAMSFVHSATEIFEMRIRLGEWGVKNSFIIAKIEDRIGVENIDEILDTADGILIARGDMGVSLAREQVPVVQAQIIQKANTRGVPVITATQMLESMIYNHYPTRAEVNDVYNAIISGSDAVMLSGETATGRYPVQAIEEMDRICRSAEKELRLRQTETIRIDGKEGLHDRMAEAVTTLVKNMKAACVIGLSLSGSTLRSLSSCRLAVPIFGVVDNISLLRQLLLHRSLFIVTMPRSNRLSDLVDPLLDRLNKKGIILSGDRVVVVSGEIDQKGRNTHLAKVYEIN